MKVQSGLRRKRLACLLGVLALVGCPVGLGHLGWNYVLGDIDIGDTISRTSDGGYFITAKGLAVGDTNPSDTWMFPMLSVKLSGSGSVRWRHFSTDLFGESVPAPGAWGTALDDGNSVAVGLTGDWNHTDSRLRVIKYSSDGNVIWNQTYGQETLLPQAVVPNSDGGVTIAGLNCYPQWATSVFVVRLDSQGNVTWRNDVDPETCLMCVYHMAIANDQSVVLVGTEAQALRISSTGQTLWARTYGMESFNIFTVDAVPDGGFVLAGISKRLGPVVPAVLRIDAYGNLLWAADEIVEAAASSHYTAWDTLVDTEGRIVLVGEMEKVEYVGNFFPRITDEGYIMQLDSNANLNWYTGLGDCYVHAVTAMTSGGYITAGTTGSHLQVIRVDTAGNVL